MTPATSTTPKGITSEADASRWMPANVRPSGQPTMTCWITCSPLIWIKGGAHAPWTAWRRVLARPEAARVLDLCCGTGDILLSLAARRANAANLWERLLPCSMLIRSTAQDRGAQTALSALRQPGRLGIAAGFRFARPDHSCVSGSAILTNYRHGLEELARVLKPGGVLAITGIFAAHQSRVREAIRILFDASPALGGRSDLGLTRCLFVLAGSRSKRSPPRKDSLSRCESRASPVSSSNA